MTRISLVLIGLSLLACLLCVRVTHALVRTALPPRRRKRSAPASSNVETPRMPAKAMTPCALTSDPACEPGYQCLAHATPMYLYNQKLTERIVYEPNLPGEGYCVPVKKRRCNPYTSDPVLIRTASGTQYDHVCQCRYPHLVSKRHLWDDCNRPIGCSPGYLTPLMNPIQYNPLTEGVCWCPQGYVSKPGPQCQKIDEAIPHDTFCVGGKAGPFKTCECPMGYLPVAPNSPSYIHAAFRQYLNYVACVKHPCSWSASDPTHFLPQAARDPETGDCQCDRLQGSFPIHSHQSILNAMTYNACQGVTRGPFADLTYECVFYGAHADETGRECWFTYTLPEARQILGQANVTTVKVFDTTQWLDRVISTTYFKEMQVKWHAPPRRNFEQPKELFDCRYQYKHRHDKSWASHARLFPLCRLPDGRAYLSPAQTQDGLLILNTRELLQDLQSHQDTRLLPRLSLRYENHDSPLKYPSEFLNT